MRGLLLALGVGGLLLLALTRDADDRSDDPSKRADALRRRWKDYKATHTLDQIDLASSDVLPLLAGLKAATTEAEFETLLDRPDRRLRRLGA